MRTELRVAVLFAATVVAPIFAVAKCPAGSVAVSGRVTSAIPMAKIEATVVVQGKKESTSRTVPVSNGNFGVEVPFSTLSRSFLGKDYCGAVPNFVEVRLTSAGKVLVQTRLRFKDSFEMVKSYEYRLKENLSMELPRKIGDGADADQQ